MFSRYYKIDDWIRLESFFLFGPRQTGKSTHLLRALPNAFVIDLLKPDVFRELDRYPEHLGEMVARFVATKKEEFPIIVIDEIQKIPALLDVIQGLIFQSNLTGQELRFVLTGSSPRRLLRAGQNLLGGRLGWRNFWSLNYAEACSDPDIVLSLRDLVQWGGLPAVLKSPQKKMLLKRYIEVYLDQEIRSEGLSRNLQKFSRFLEMAALASGQQVSMRGLASDVGMSEKTVAAWFAILEDTLVGHLLPCFKKTHKRKAMATSKFYFFDCGLANAILNRFSLVTSTPEFGIALEGYVYQNLSAYCARSPEKDLKLFYWRTTAHEEVDFVITRDGEPAWVIEVKSSERQKEADFLGLNAFAEDFPNVRKTLAARISEPRLRSDGIEVVPIEHLLLEIGK